MSVSNIRDGHSHDIFNTGLRFQWQERSIANTDVVVLPVDAAPVQLITTTGTGPAVVRLPLLAKDGKIIIIRSIGTQSIAVTDNAGSPNTVTGSPVTTTTSGIFMKKGAAGVGSWVMIFEGTAVA